MEWEWGKPISPGAFERDGERIIDFGNSKARQAFEFTTNDATCHLPFCHFPFAIFATSADHAIASIPTLCKNTIDARCESVGGARGRPLPSSIDSTASFRQDNAKNTISFGSLWPPAAHRKWPGPYL
jgi:hypothetical protein